MKKILSVYLLCLGTIELTFVFIGERLPFLVRPYAGILWSSVFVESRIAAVGFSLLVTLFLLAVGIATLVGKSRLILVAFSIVWGVIAVIDLYLPVAVLMSGGSHALTMDGAAIMLLVGLFVDLIPIGLSTWVVLHPVPPQTTWIHQAEPK